MGFDTFSETDPVIALVFWMGVGVIVCSVLLLIGVLLLRTHVTADERHRRAFMAAWRPRFAACTSGERQVNLPPVPPGDTLLFLNAWLYYHEALLGEAKDDLNELFSSLKMETRTRQLLRKGNLRGRLLAAAALGHARDRESWPALIDTVDEENPVLSLTAARALVCIDPAAAVVCLAPSISTRSDWSPPKVVALLKEAGADVACEPLCREARQASPADAARLVKYLSAIRCIPSLPVLRELLTASQAPELTSACVAALGDLADPRDLAEIRRLTVHEAAEVRVEATCALGKLGGREDVERLTALLGDRDWWVRYRAAEALAGLPFVRPERLEQIRDRHEDPFARDIVTQVLAERRLRRCP